MFQVLLGIWYFSQPLDPPKKFLKRLSTEGGQSILHLTDKPVSDYYLVYNKDLCLKEGTVKEKSSDNKCVCRVGWQGRRCGVPEIMHRTAWMKNTELTKNLQLMRRVRRVFLVAPFSYEFDIFETNVFELNGIVDVFIIGEINDTHPNTTSSLPLLKKLKSGWLKDYQDKMIYVPIYKKDMKNSSVIQNLVHTGLRLVTDIRPDDLIIMTTGEEILSRAVVLFLKIFRGYPLPVKCRFDHYLYGFYWQLKDNGNSTFPTAPQVCAVSFQFLANAFEYKVSRLQAGSILEEDLNFFTQNEQPVVEWTIPESGWRCHLCLSVQAVYHKFCEYPENLQPKWLTNSSSSMLPFIQRLVKFGQDENLDPVGKVRLSKKEDVPQHIWNHRERFVHLLENPYETVSIHNLT